MNNEEKIGQEPAFPVSDPNTALAMFNAGIDPTGMSKRFYAACMAMQGLITTGIATERGIYNPSIGKMSFEIADELLKVEQL